MEKNKRIKNIQSFFWNKLQKILQKTRKGGVKKHRFLFCFLRIRFFVFGLLCRSVLGHSLGAFRHGMFCQLARKNQTNSGLDFPGAQGWFLGVATKTTGFGGNVLKDVIDKGVHDAHRLAGNGCIGVHLLQHLEDVRGIRFGAVLLAFCSPSLIYLNERDTFFFDKKSKLHNESTQKKTGCCVRVVCGFFEK